MDEQIQHNEAAINLLWKSKPAVARWCRMCYVLSEYLRYAAQLADADLDVREAFCRAIGYLSKSPKPLVSSALVSQSEWDCLVYCSQQEMLDISRAFSLLLYRFREWAQLLDGDEDDGQGFPRKVWMLAKDFKVENLFKSVCGHHLLRTKFFRELEGEMRSPIQMPQDQGMIPDVGDDEAVKRYRRSTIEYLSRIAANSDILASDSLSAGQARARVGTTGEISQEDEVLKRYHANGDRGLRSFVAAVLRDHTWQLRDGHKNTEKGRQKCYSRVYELLHPSRRKH